MVIPGGWGWLAVPSFAGLPPPVGAGERLLPGPEEGEEEREEEQRLRLHRGVARKRQVPFRGEEVAPLYLPLHVSPTPGGLWYKWRRNFSELTLSRISD